MRSINAPVTLKLLFSLCWFIALAIIKNAVAGEYFTYRDLKGNVVLSNSAPPAGSQIIKREALPEVTDQQLAESRIRDENVGLDNRLASLEKSIDELSANLRAQIDAIDNLQQGSSDGSIAVGMTQGAGIVRKPPRRNLPRHDFTHVQRRGTIPSQLQQRPGARGRS